MNIELVKLTVEYREQLFEMLTEWKNDIIENHTDMSPWKIWANDFHNLEYYIENLDTKENDETLLDSIIAQFVAFYIFTNSNIEQKERGRSRQYNLLQNKSCYA